MISIIIINYNTFDLTCSCIKSVIQNTKNIVCEIILIDNASTECDPDLFLEQFSNIRLMKSKSNLGFAKGNNIGIDNAKGDIILLLNSDTIIKENCIDIAFSTLINNSKIGALSVKLLFPTGEIQPQCTRFPSVFLLILEMTRLHKFLPKKNRGKLFLSTYFDHISYIETDAIWGTFFMFKKEILEFLPNKKLNDEYFMYYEDIQWCIDIKRAGYKIVYQPLAETIHIMGKRNEFKKCMCMQSRIHFINKNFIPIKKTILKLLKY